MTTRAISLKRSVSQSKVSRIAQSIKENILLQQTGRPSQFSPSLKRLLVYEIITGNLNTAVDAIRGFSTVVSVERVQQVLRAEGVTAHHK
ncbi:hypothetical protein BGX21_007007, partial [Mortierella sp. AD011]